jgi:LacI family transcriptional regulator
MAPAVLREVLAESDGLIAINHPPQWGPELAHATLPMVACLLGLEPDRPRVIVDNPAVGRIGAEHFLAAGFENYGFVGMNWGVSVTREDAFIARLAEDGHTCYTTAAGPGGRDRWTWEQMDDEDLIAGWLEVVEKPIAVMAVKDETACATVIAAQRLGLRVPEDVAVLGIDNNRAVCDISPVPLSSVRVDFESAGREAARLLRAVLDKADHEHQAPIGPSGIARRKSTDVYAFTDPALVAALAFIRDRAAEGISVGDVIQAVPASRSSLQRKFRDVLGRRIGDEIRRICLAEARSLLRETDLPLVDVAERAGLNTLSHMTRLFQKHLGCTPGQYRINHLRR